MADIIGEKAERELRGTVYADALMKELLVKVIRECQENPVEPTPIKSTPITYVIKAKSVTEEGRGRGWRRAAGMLK